MYRLTTNPLVPTIVGYRMCQYVHFNAFTISNLRQDVLKLFDILAMGGDNNNNNNIIIIMNLWRNC